MPLANERYLQPAHPSRARVGQRINANWYAPEKSIAPTRLRMERATHGEWKNLIRR